MNNTLYIIDSCAVIDILKCYPIDIFPAVWHKYDKLVHENRIRAPSSVYNEIKNDQGDGFRWVKKHSKRIFLDDSRFVGTATKIQDKFPHISRKYSQKNEADAYVVAMAYDLNQTQTLNQRDVCVVTEEGKKERGGKTKIPTVCNHYKIKCLKFLEMTKSEGWKF